MDTTATVKYAGFWWRVLAYMVDGALISIPLYLGYYGLMIVMVLAGDQPPTEGDDEAEKEAMKWVILGGVMAVMLFLFIANWLYFTLFESSKRMATPGKFWLGFVVTDMHGKRIGFGRANARYWSKYLSSIIFCIGYIMVAFTKKKQGLHDMVAKTLVVKNASQPQQPNNI